MLHLIVLLLGGNIAFLREEVGTRSVTEGARVTLVFNKFYRNALSLTRLRRELPPGGSLFYVHLYLVNFPDKHCFCGHKSEAPREAGRGLQIGKPFFDVQITRIIFYRGKYVIVVVEISQVSMTERFLAVL